MSDKGFTDKVKGKVKKAVGDATGDNSAYLCYCHIWCKPNFIIAFIT